LRMFSFQTLFIGKQGDLGSMLLSHFLQKLAVVWSKNANIFAKFFAENIFKNKTSLPDCANFSLWAFVYFGQLFEVAPKPCFSHEKLLIDFNDIWFNVKFRTFFHTYSVTLLTNPSCCAFAASVSMVIFQSK
jgi:hypothetical protein